MSPPVRAAALPAAAPPARRRRRWPVERIVAVASPIVLLALWELLARTDVLDRRILPPPTDVVRTIVDLVRDGALLRDSLITVARFFVGMVVGTVPGTLIGLSMGIFRWVRIPLNPLVAAFYPVPRIALFPLILILVGLNETSNVIMIALGPFFTMLITAHAAVASIDPIYKDVARNFQTRPRDLYLRIMLPASLPVLMGGIRISLGLALLGTVAAEFLIGNDGLGHLIWNSWQLLSLKQSMAGLVVTALIGAAFYVSMDWVERFLVPWQPSDRSR